MYVHYGDDGLRGSEQCLLNLLENCEQMKVTPVVWTNNLSLCQTAERLAIKTIFSEFSVLLGWQKPRWNFVAAYKQVQQGVDLIKQHKIDLVHCNSAAPTQWMQIACKRCNTKLLTHLHAPYPLRDRLTLGIANADKIVCVNDQIALQCFDDGVHPDRVTQISNGLDLSKQTQRFPMNLKQQLGIKNQKKLLITVASLQQEKGVDLCIQALAKVNSQQTVHLAIVGEGPERDQLMGLAKSLNIAQRIHFLGASDIVPSLLHANVDGFICGSRAESFGLAIAEAMLAKCPVVAPKVGGIPMLVKHQQTGLLYQAQDTAAFAEAIELLIEFPAQGKQRVELAYQHVRDNFSMDQHIQRFLTCYQNLLADSKDKANKLWPAYMRLFKLMCKVTA
nr:glycosyltransferase family 4 protein [Marinifaba aquimaris]